MQRNVNFDRLAMLVLRLNEFHAAVLEVPRTKPGSIFAPAGREAQKIERQSRLGAERMTRFVLIDFRRSQRVMAALRVPDLLDGYRRIVRRLVPFNCPREQYLERLEPGIGRPKAR